MTSANPSRRLSLELSAAHSSGAQVSGPEHSGPHRAPHGRHVGHGTASDAALLGSSEAPHWGHTQIVDGSEQSGEKAISPFSFAARQVSCWAVWQYAFTMFSPAVQLCAPAGDGPGTFLMCLLQGAEGQLQYWLPVDHSVGVILLSGAPWSHLRLACAVVTLCTALVALTPSFQT